MSRYDDRYDRREDMCDTHGNTRVKRKIRVGDKYDVPVEVVGITDRGGHGADRYLVAIRGRRGLARWICEAALETSALVEAAPEPLRVGDRVISSQDLFESLEVLCLHNDAAWLLGPDGSHYSRNLAYLKRVG